MTSFCTSVVIDDVIKLGQVKPLATKPVNITLGSLLPNGEQLPQNVPVLGSEALRALAPLRTGKFCRFFGSILQKF